jgi:hypothetical protein
MENTYFSRLLPELAEKSVQAAIRRLHIQNKPLAAYLRNTLSTQLGTKGSLLGDPVLSRHLAGRLTRKPCKTYRADCYRHL